MNTQDSHILSTFKKLQEIPTVPFAPMAMKSFILSQLPKEYVDIEVNDYSIIVSPKVTQASPKLIVMAHIDHPGIILKNNQTGIIMGTMKLRPIQNGSTIPIKVFSPTGNFITKGEIIRRSGKNSQMVHIQIQDGQQIPKNSLAQYDIDYYSEDGDKAYVYNADNGISVAILIEIIKKFKSSKWDVTFVFTLFEDVHQVSSWWLAHHNILQLTQQDLVVNLECLKINNVNESKYPRANYTNGVVLQLSNAGCLFGYKSTQDNQAEQLIRQIAKINSIPLQIGIIKDSCDSRPFTEFNLTPNIVTTTIPNQFKHNENELDEIVPEEIYKIDITNQYRLIQLLLHTDTTELNKASKISSITQEIKKKNDVTDIAAMKRKSRLNRRLAIAYLPVIKRGYYFPQSVHDYFQDILWKSVSYISYTWRKIFLDDE